MKRVIRLTESELVKVVKKVIKESSLKADPYSLKADNGDVLITKGTETLKYKMEAWSLFNWWDCDVQDFPEGKNIKLKVAGNIKIAKIDTQKIKILLDKGFGKKVLETTITDDKGEKQDVKFTKIVN